MLKSDAVFQAEAHGMSYDRFCDYARTQDIVNAGDGNYFLVSSVINSDGIYETCTFECDANGKITDFDDYGRDLYETYSDFKEGHQTVLQEIKENPQDYVNMRDERLEAYSENDNDIDNYNDYEMTKKDYNYVHSEVIEYKEGEFCLVDARETNSGRPELAVFLCDSEGKLTTDFECTPLFSKTYDSFEEMSYSYSDIRSDIEYGPGQWGFNMEESVQEIKENPNIDTHSPFFHNYNHMTFDEYKEWRIAMEEKEQDKIEKEETEIDNNAETDNGHWDNADGWSNAIDVDEGINTIDADDLDNMYDSDPVD